LEDSVVEGSVKDLSNGWEIEEKNILSSLLH
jgi:hypothetical protein